MGTVWHPRRARREDGASAVEFALVLVPFLTLVLGIVYFGIVLSQQLALGNAARQAARLGAVSTTCGGVVSAAQGAATSIMMTPSDVTVEVKRRDVATGNLVAVSPTACPATTSGASTVKPCAGSASGDSVVVVLRYTSRPALPFFSPSIGLGGQGEFRCEYS